MYQLPISFILNVVIPDDYFQKDILNMQRQLWVVQPF